MDAAERPSRNSERVLAAEQLAELRALQQRMSEFAALLQGNIVNDTLEMGTFTFPNPAVVTRAWHATAGGIMVQNLNSGNDITVVTGGAAGTTAPTGGVGVWVVKNLATVTIPVAARAVTFYGAAGERFCYAAFTGAVRPVSGAR